MVLLELAGGCEAAGEDAVMDGCKVGWALLELAARAIRRSLVESGVLRSGTRKVAIARLKGRIGSTPCTM